MNIRRRIETLEKRFSFIKKEKPLVPIGIALGCPPEAFINWYDFLLHSSSRWHRLSSQEKFDVIREFCYKPGDNLPEYISDLEVELLDCNIALFRAEEDVRRRVKPDEEFEYEELTKEEKDTYNRVWQEEEEKLKGAIKPSCDCEACRIS